jgi:ribosomal protein L40E
VEGVVALAAIFAVLWIVIDAISRVRRRREDERRVEAAVAAGRDTKTCDECLSEVPLAARKCAHCGSRFRY